MLDRKSCKKMLVWDDNESMAVERIVVDFYNENGVEYQWLVVSNDFEDSFYSGGYYCTIEFKHAQPIPEQQYVQWESIDEIPDEFFDGWVNYDNIKMCFKINYVNYGENTVKIYGTVFTLKMLFETFTWSPTFRGEYKPCGKLVEKK